MRSYLNGREWQLVAEFTEVESGRRSDRPEFAKALAASRLHRATLVIAKLDRLSRNVHFVSSLMEAGVEFVAVDFPQANRLTIHIIAAVAEHEAAMISARTKAALAHAKKNGRKLGGFRGVIPNARARKLSAEALRQRTAARVAAIAAGLNERGIPTSRGDGEWSATQVARVLERLP